MTAAVTLLAKQRGGLEIRYQALLCRTPSLSTLVSAAKAWPEPVDGTSPTPRIDIE